MKLCELLDQAGFNTLQVDDTTVEYMVSKDGKRLEIAMIKTPKEKRGQGGARKALSQLLAMADTKGIQVVLTAEPMDKATSKAKLEKFYKSLGFVSNRGRNKDYTTKASMIRAPKN